MTNPYVRFIDEPLLSFASKVTEVWYRTLRTAPPRQMWIALIVFFVPFFLLNCALIPRSAQDIVSPGASTAVALAALLGSIAMLVTASARLKMTSTIWDAQRYKIGLTTAARQVQTGRIIRIVFPISGFVIFVGTPFRLTQANSMALVTAELGLWFIAITMVSYLMACEPPKPDDGDGFALLPTTAS
jgi:hypothetical protein